MHLNHINKLAMWTLCDLAPVFTNSPSSRPETHRSSDRVPALWGAMTIRALERSEGGG